MNRETPKRIAIIGPPGSGKSTFAVKLGKLLNISVHHLDTHCFIGRTKRDQKEFAAIQQELVDQES
jgi:adenylate kinase family enzyme